MAYFKCKKATPPFRLKRKCDLKLDQIIFLKPQYKNRSKPQQISFLSAAAVPSIGNNVFR